MKQIDRKKIAGFSLIETAMILGVIGLLVAALLQSYNHFSLQQPRNKTIANTSTIHLALARFILNEGRLPCPADPALPMSDPDAGRENCLGGPLGPNPNVGYCEGDVCRRDGRRPTANTTPVMERIMTGAIPYETLSIANTTALDGWSNKMTYAVTEWLTVPFNTISPGKGFHVERGAISKFFYNRVSGADEIVANQAVLTAGAPTPDSYMLAVISHGPDGKGAYNVQGIQSIPCGATRDSENCDGDAIFLEPNHRSTGNNADFYDDEMVLMDVIRDTDKWTYGTVDAMQNKQSSSGVIGIGINNPTQKLEVDGTVRSNEIHATEICDPTFLNATPEGYCFPAKIIGGTGIGCPGVMEKVAGGAAVCVTKVSTSTIVPSDCPTGQFAVGIGPSGNIRCCPGGQYGSINAFGVFVCVSPP